MSPDACIVIFHV